MRSLTVIAAIAAATFGACAFAKSTPAEVEIGHHLDAAATEELERLVARFNAGEKSGSVRLRRLPPDRMLGAPANMMLIDDDSGSYLAGRRYEPLHRFLPANGVRFDPKTLYPAMRNAVDDAGGHIQALPLALALPVLYWNKDAFQRAKRDPSQAPRTWDALQDVSGELFDAGYRCPYASSWPVWVHVENVAAVHNQPFLASERGATRLTFNGLVYVKHIARLSSWLKSRYFHLFGVADEADAKFRSGECAVLTSGSNLYPKLRDKVSFSFGVADLPYYDDVYDAHPTRVVPAGSVMWVMAGKPRDENRLTARFVAYLLEPAVQKEWVAATGFLPMTNSSGVTEVAGLGRSPAQLLGQELSEQRNLAALRARDVAEFGRMRAILVEELSTVWANTKAPKEALDAAVRRGNLLLNGSAKSR